jgi:hypothetical protein
MDGKGLKVGDAESVSGFLLKVSEMASVECCGGLTGVHVITLE